MIRELILKFGPDGPVHTLTLSPATMTVFVGPNGSGKSLALKELQHFAENGPGTTSKIVETVMVDVPNHIQARDLLHTRQVPYPPGTARQANYINVSKQVPATGSVSTFQINEEYLIAKIATEHSEQKIRSPSPQSQMLFTQFVNLFTVALDGRTRFALVEERNVGDLQGTPQNHLVALFTDDKARRRVREIIADAFGLYFVIDPTNVGRLRIRLAARPPNDEQEEQALDQRARDFHAAATDISELSDGVKAFTGIVSALISSDFRIIIIDEPDAFLHPPLARKLGYRVTALAAERSANVLSATHSAEFLMGCVESGKPLNIVRLTYERGRPTARTLPATELAPLMRDPLLRSTNVLSALFHLGAVVCEADTDRSFYQEINTRLLAAQDSGIRDTVFLQAQNKQTVRRIVEPLRKMGIPAAAIVDIDILKGGDLKALMDACAVPRELAHSLTVLRGDLEAHFQSLGNDMKNGGLKLLKGEHAESCRSLLDQLAAFGIFVVPNGAVECWLIALGIRVSKNEWLASIFEAMGSDPDATNYIHPSDDDVWAFIRSVAGWVHNPARRGIPTAHNRPN